MPGRSPDDLEPLDTWSDAGLEPLDEGSDEADGELPELPQLPQLHPSDLDVPDPEPDAPLPELPPVLPAAAEALGPPVVVLPWHTTATVDQVELETLLCPSLATSELYEPSASQASRTVRIELGPVRVRLEVAVVAQGPPRLLAGRDVLGRQILVSSEEP